MSCKCSVSQPFASRLRRFALVLGCAALLLGVAGAQDSASVPTLIKFSGTISGAPAGSVGVIFALYAEQTGGAPLWQEVQSVTVDASGHYVALLGSSSAAGIPVGVFSNNEARWLDVQVQGQSDQPRVVLVSVPYALKASDAQTLGGLPPSAFLRADPATTTATSAAATTASVNTAAASQAVVSPALTDSGTKNYIPVFTDNTGDLGNSGIYQLNGGTVANPEWWEGIGTTSPAFNLNVVSSDPADSQAAIDIDGYGTVGINFIGRRAEGTLAAPTGLLANDNIFAMQGRGWFQSGTSGVPSGFSQYSRAYMKFFAAEPWTDTAQGTYISLATNTPGTAPNAPATERMRITGNGNVGIGTAAPAYPLTVNGIIQSTSGGFKFPDGSTLATANTVPSTASGNTFTGNQTINGSETVNGMVTGNASVTGGEAVLGNGTTAPGASGVAGESSTSFGVYGDSLTPASGAAGVFGFTAGAFSSVYSSEAGIASAGVWGDTAVTSGSVPVAIFGTADAAYAGAFINNSPDFPALFVDNNGGAGLVVDSTSNALTASAGSGYGVEGVSEGGGSGVEGVADSLTSQDAGVLGIGNTTSATYGSYNIYAGVWGDTGTNSTNVAPAWAIGVLGTADNSHAGVFLNNSSGWSTMYISNASTGGTGTVAGGVSHAAGLYATLKAETSTGTCGIGGNGDLTCTGQVKTLATTGGGARTVETYAMQSPENWMEDFGSGTLTGGSAVVQIDPVFADTVSATADYHVFITPNGDSKGLYVTNKTASSFEVHESGGGLSSLSFDYRIVAKRRGYEAQRMADVTESLKAEKEGLKPQLSAHASGAIARPAASPLIPKGHSVAPRKPVPGVQPIASKPATRP